MENNQINSLIIFSPYYPPHIGGLESHAFEFSEIMAAKEKNVIVFTACLPRASSEEKVGERHYIFRYPAVEIINNFPLPKFWTYEFWKQLNKIKTNKNTVVISRTRFFPSSFIAYVFASLHGMPLLHIEHGSDFVQTRNIFVSTLAKLYDLSFGHFVLHFSNRVVANSIASANFVQRLCKKATPIVIYRGVRGEQIRELGYSVNKIESEKIRIGYVGRLIDGKGVHVLIGALARISSENFELSIVGDGPSKKHLQILVQKDGLEDRVVFYGAQNFENAVKLIASMDIFVNPSFTEGLPTAVIEAAMCGCAIVATDVGGTREIVGKESAVFVQPGDDVALSNAIMGLIKDNEYRKKIGRMAQKEVESKFDWKHNVREYQKVFNELSNV